MEDCIHGLCRDWCSICLAGPAPAKRRGRAVPKKPVPRRMLNKWSVLPAATNPVSGGRAFVTGLFAPSFDDRRFNTPGKLEGQNRAPKPFPRTRSGQRTEGRVSSTYPRNTY